MAKLDKKKKVKVTKRRIKKALVNTNTPGLTTSQYNRVLRAELRNERKANRSL